MVKINKINIKAFGNIQNLNLDLDHSGPTIIYGKNESGKTTLIDAILYALFSTSKQKYVFNKINRDYTPTNKIYKLSDDAKKENNQNIFNGNIELKIDNKSVNFPQTKSLDEIISIPPQFASNIFVVREGDLKFSDTANWWNLLKTRLAGFSGDYLRITKRINEVVNTELKMNFVDTNELPVKSWKEKLEKKLNDIKEVKKSVKGLAELELTHKVTNEKLEKCKKNINDLKIAKKKHIYQKSKILVDKQKKTQNKIIEYEKYNIANLKIWHNTEIEILKAKEILNLSKKHRDSYTSFIDNNFIEIENAEKEVDEWAKIEKEFIPALESKLAEHKRKKARLQRGSSAKSMLPIWITISFLSLAFSIYISINVNPVFYTISGIIFIAICYNAKVWFSSKSTQTNLRLLERLIKENFKHIYNKDESVENISAWLFEKRNTNQEQIKRARNIKNKKLPDQEKIAKELTLSINTLDNKLKKLENFTGALKKETGCSTWEVLQKKCNEKETLDINIKMLTEQINQLLDTKFEIEWEDKLKEQESNEEVKVEWDRNLNKRQNEQYESLIGELKELDDKIVTLKIDAGELGCKNLQEVWLKEDEIKKEISKYKTETQAALIATEIIEAVSKDQDKLINKIIEEGHTSASKLFSTITDHRYKKVYLEKNNIYVKSFDDKIFHSDFLSTGTLAQLYFSIRINFAENLMGKRPAFLIMDDPFLACDSTREASMVKTLKNISDNGWQFIYFTVDEDIVNTFIDCFKNKVKIHNMSTLK